MTLGWVFGRIGGMKKLTEQDIEKLAIELLEEQGFETRGKLVRLIDFENPANNNFCAINQFTVIEEGHNHRPDIVLFINGFPLVVIELKNPRAEKTTIVSAYNQLQNYKQYIPSLFTYNSLLVVSDGLEAKVGSVFSKPDRFMAWKSIDGKQEVSRHINQLETLIKGLLNKKTLLDMIRHFTVF